MDFKLILQIAGVILGLLYLYLEYKADIRLWIVGLLMPLVHGTLYFKSGLYADFGMQMYYVAAGLWGLGAWLVSGKKKKIGNGSGISGTPAWLYPVLGVVAAGLTAGLYFFLSLCTDSTVPFWDALTTAMSMVALWMLAKKYTEQWLVWFAVDAISCGLYLYKGIPLTACLYLLYTVLSIVGYRKWKRSIS